MDVFYVVCWNYNIYEAIADCRMFEKSDSDVLGVIWIVIS